MSGSFSADTNIILDIGEVLHERYRVVQKLGAGRYSAVYLARDQKELSYKAIKLLREDRYDGEHDLFELEILKHLREADPNHPGYQHITILLDDSIYISRSGSQHVCLVMEPMAEDMKTFPLFFEGARIPNHIMKKVTKQLLSALDYAHGCGVIHTGIWEDSLSNPAADLGEYNFDDASELVQADVVLGDWGSASWVEKHLTDFIQPTLLRAPEVDIWNLGALLPELLEALRMFSGRADVTGGVYLTKHHLEEIEALFGPVPPELLQSGEPQIVQQFFDEEFNFRDWTQRSPASIDGPEKANFISMIRSMLVIDPKQRMAALSLHDAPWLNPEK
ncbi:kinase-like protein [Aspergillus vadensis CBS 113365]|uniref:Kinase-like protein n=1 Tax=Aspergillus vadensis (strain CBS 113365 / IMI 142717 / IBT 24658) TaxID=1448311 RepID=A0A319B9G2_ASPVC|nr:kinase-like protein [Aspergillus vadensis CBS 113365]PYH68484.1 kinase-like protein [Aspergillus vadensis CBS 113365]